MSDVLLFARRWLANPLTVAAIVPSGRSLSEAMAAEVPPGDGPVVELGGGTGAATTALLRTIPPERLTVFECDATLCRLLRLRFPQTRVVEADAALLPAEIEESVQGKVRAVVSGLPLLSMTAARRREILVGAFATLAPDGVFVQFTYGFGSPVPRRELAAIGLQPLRRAFTWRNLPPATVWLFVRRDQGQA